MTDRITGADREHVPFAVWEELRESLRASPDHLIARADELVTAAEPDPNAIYRFVRDEIVTYPAGTTWFSDLREQMRWGVRGTLRGGAGTPREKAELLADLYRRAGWDAGVLFGAGLADPDPETKRLLWRPLDRRFEPALDDETVEDWQRRVGQSPEDLPAVDVIDEDGRESRRLGAEVYGLLPTEELRPSDFRWGRRGALPMVRVVVDGVERYADLFTLDASFGEIHQSVGSLRESPETAETLPVEVTLSAATADSPEDPFDLVSGSWSADDLVGRQLLVQTLPGVDPFERPAVRFSDVGTFVPALTLQAVDLDAERMAELSAVGDAVSRAGDRLRVESDGSVSRNGLPLLSPTVRPESADVAEIGAVTDSGRFPEVRLDVDVRDDDGNPVEGLPATAFEVRDEREAVGVTLVANRVAPRVLILSDTSGSMPYEYRGEGMETLVETLRSRILDEYPNAQISHKLTKSNLWTSLGEAAGSDANLIVYATDGHVRDELTPPIETALRDGPPAVMLSVFDDLSDENLQEMANATGGVLEPASDHQSAEGAIMRYLENLVPELPTYTLTFGSAAGPGAWGTRRVTVRVAGSDAEGTSSYIVPESPAVPNHLAGLYLTVAVGDREVTRTLAGYDPALHADDAVTREMLDEVAGALFGSRCLAFEAAAAPLSVWLDDVLTAKLSTAELDAALQAEDPEAVSDRLDAGFMFVPPELSLLLGPLPDAVTDRSVTFQDGLRVVLYQERPVFGERHVVKQADLLPLAGFATAAADPLEGYRITLEKTARLAVVESELFETSTRSLLAGRRLEEFSEVYDTLRGAEDDVLAAQWYEMIRRRDEYRGDYNFVPADGRPMAFWNVDPTTGELLGVLADGSGGGRQEERIREAIREVDRVMAFYRALMAVSAGAGAAVPGAFALGVVSLYGQTLVRLYGAASLTIAAMDANQLDEDVQQSIVYFACSVARATVLKALGWFAGALSNILSIGGATPLGCSG
ncbi:hypothetical protein ACFQE1_06540 [Halobium palmae]|uniref:VWA domain-containing protein n=1 Tax=Halobium palmae TaxID=1776492 RepID=A0ABD5RXQ9_9EURY